MGLPPPVGAISPRKGTYTPLGDFAFYAHLSIYQKPLQVSLWYIRLMKKHYFFIAVLVLLVGVVVTLSIQKYNAQPKGITTAEAISQRNTALTDLKIQKALNDNDQQAITNLTADKKALTDQKTTLCAQIKAAKLTQPLCQ